jgi:hypothetical protein
VRNMCPIRKAAIREITRAAMLKLSMTGNVAAGPLHQFSFGGGAQPFRYAPLGDGWGFLFFDAVDRDRYGVVSDNQLAAPRGKSPAIAIRGGAAGVRGAAIGR